MSARPLRQVHKEGHVLKFLTIIDDSPECESAVYFAACRARNTGSQIVLAYIVEPEEFQHWIRVEEAARAEGEQRGQAVLRLYRRKLKGWGFDDIVVEELIKHGEVREQITEIVRDDHDIAFLVLGASTGSEGPGRLVSWLAGQQAGHFLIPIVLVPGALEFKEIEALA